MKILSGKELTTIMEERLAEDAAALAKTGRAPALAVVRVGDDAATGIYVRNKMRAAERVGIAGNDVHLPADATQTELEAELERLNRDAEINALICQLPLPGHMKAERIPERIDPIKDVDCFHPFNFGLMAMGTPRFLPCTPAGVLELLRHYEIPIAGQRVVILGRSNIVGRPLAILLGQKSLDATVTLCHSRTEDAVSIARDADIVVAAIGKPEWVQADMIKEGAVVIDVGIHRMEDPTRESGSRLCGDVEHIGVGAKASALTPVPGGVGPMTITMLLRNTLTAARLQRN